MIGRKYISMKMVISSLAYLLVIIGLSIVSASRGVSYSLFDYVSNIQWGGSASVLVLVVGVLPVLALVLPLLIDQLENEMIVVRIKHKRKLFYDHLIISLFISASFTVLMVFSGIVAALIATGNVHNLWGTKEGTIYFLLDNKSYFPLYIPHVTSLKVWAYLISSRFLGISFMATCVIFLKTVLKKNIYVFFISLIILGTDGLFSERFNLFLGRLRITLDTWIDPQEQLFNLVYFVLGIIVMSLICLKFYDKKEFYH